jgi:hypothetical protein
MTTKVRGTARLEARIDPELVPRAHDPITPVEILL